MDREYIYQWWMKKYHASIVNYINANLQFEDLDKEGLQNKRKELLLDFVNDADGGVFEYLIVNSTGFLERIYKDIYESAQV